MRRRNMRPTRSISSVGVDAIMPMRSAKTAASRSGNDNDNGPSPSSGSNAGLLASTGRPTAIASNTTLSALPGAVALRTTSASRSKAATSARGTPSSKRTAPGAHRSASAAARQDADARLR